MTPIDQFLMGFISPLSGLRLILSSKKKFTLSIFPFVIASIIFIFGFLWAYQTLGPAAATGLEGIEFLSGFLLTSATVLVGAFYWIAFLTFAFLFCYVLISIFGGPFYSMLAEDVFKTESGEAVKGSTFKLILTMFFFSIMKAFLFFFVGLLCFILSFVPVLNLFSTYILFMIVAFDCTDYAFEVDYLSLRQRFQFFFSNFWAYSGLAVAVLASSLIPGAFFLLLPGFICGATKMYIQLSNK